MAGRLVILSDLHLGRPRWAAPSAASVRPLWQGASRLILNGDIAELHHPKYAEAAEGEMLELLTDCEADGVMLTLLAGNHDPFVSDHKHVLLAGDTILVTHGDVFHPAIAPWSIAARNTRQVSIEGLNALEPEHRDNLLARLAISHRASLVEWDELAHQSSKSSLHNMVLRPWALLQVLQYWRDVPRLAAQFAESCAPDAEFVICGHTHHQGIWTVGSRTIINTGSFGFPGRPRAVLVEGRRLEVRRVNYRRGAYKLAPGPLYVAELPEPVSMPSALNTRPFMGRSSRAAM